MKEILRKESQIIKKKEPGKFQNKKPEDHWMGRKEVTEESVT